VHIRYVATFGVLHLKFHDIFYLPRITAEKELCKVVRVEVVLCHTISKMQRSEIEARKTHTHTYTHTA